MKKQYSSPCMEVLSTRPVSLLCASLGHDALPHVTFDDVDTVDDLTADVKQGGGAWDDIWE